MFNSPKSPETLDNSTITHKMMLLLNEQKHQRGDLATIKRQLHSIINSLALQKQVDEYFEDDETSPQTDSGQQNDSGSR